MYSYFMPTKLIAGTDCLKNNSSQMILGSRAVIITGKSSGKSSGALGEVQEILERENIPWSVYDRIENNPSLECVWEAGQFAKSQKADFVIGIGGGSPLDSAKAAAVYAANTIAPMDIFKGVYPVRPLPICAIPTTAGTGSEVTPYSILTLNREQTKKSFTSPECFPAVAFLDGRYNKNVPLQTARNTAVDAMSHCIEGYLNKKASPATDYIALEGLRILARHLKGLMDGALSVDDCTELLFAASLGGMVIAQTGTTIVHSMGYQLTYHKDIPHGMANGLLLGKFAMLCQGQQTQKVQRLLKALSLPSLKELCRTLASLLPCKTSFSPEELESYAKISIQAKNVESCPFPVTRELETEILKDCLLNR